MTAGTSTENGQVINLYDLATWQNNDPTNRAEICAKLGFLPCEQALAVLGGFIDNALTRLDGREINPGLAIYYPLFAKQRLEAVTPPLPRIS